MKPIRTVGGIEIVLATRPEEKSMIAIHLLNPTEDELMDALETAQKDLFPRIVIHGEETWFRKQA